MDCEEQRQPFDQTQHCSLSLYSPAAGTLQTCYTVLCILSLSSIVCCCTYLSLLQLLVQFLLQVDDIKACCWRAGHILHPQLPISGPLPAKNHKSVCDGQDQASSVACPRVPRPHLGGKMELRMSSVGVTPDRCSTGGRDPCLHNSSHVQHDCCWIAGCGMASAVLTAAVLLTFFPALPSLAALPLDVETKLGVSNSTRDFRGGGMLSRRLFVQVNAGTSLRNTGHFETRDASHTMKYQMRDAIIGSVLVAGKVGRALPTSEVTTALVRCDHRSLGP